MTVENLVKNLDHSEGRIRLPPGQRKYVRGLKAQGRDAEAQAYADRERTRKGWVPPEQKRTQRAESELNRILSELPAITDPQKRIYSEIKIIWLREATGEILPEERQAELLARFNELDQNSPNLEQLKDALGRIMARARDEVKPLMPPSVATLKRGRRA